VNILMHGWPVEDFSQMFVHLGDTTMTRGWTVVGLVKERGTKSSRDTDPFGALGRPDEGTGRCDGKAGMVAPRANLLASVSKEGLPLVPGVPLLGSKVSKVKRLCPR
jgi:hypothetical protein